MIGYFLIRKFKVQIQFGRIALPFLLKDVKIQKNGYSMVTIIQFAIKKKCFLTNILKIFQQIEDIGIRSSFFSSDVTKLLSINIRGIRINKDIKKASSTSSSSGGSTAGGSPQEDFSTETNNVFDFRNRKVPPSIITFAQVIHIFFLKIKMF